MSTETPKTALAMRDRILAVLLPKIDGLTAYEIAVALKMTSPTERDLVDRTLEAMRMCDHLQRSEERRIVAGLPRDVWLAITVPAEMTPGRVRTWHPPKPAQKPRESGVRKAIREALEKHGPMTAAALRRHLPDVRTDSLRMSLTEMKSLGILKKHAQRGGCWCLPGQTLPPWKPTGKVPPSMLRIVGPGATVTTEDGRVWQLIISSAWPHAGKVVAEEVSR